VVRRDDLGAQVTVWETGECVLDLPGCESLCEALQLDGDDEVRAVADRLLALFGG
jgi:hypothetical protein